MATTMIVKRLPVNTHFSLDCDILSLDLLFFGNKSKLSLDICPPVIGYDILKCKALASPGGLQFDLSAFLVFGDNFGFTYFFETF